MNHTPLPPFHITKTTRLVVEADHALTLDLKAYGEFYAQAHGAKVDEAELLREMARLYMAVDTDFQAFRHKPRRRRRVKPAQPAPETSA